MIFGNNSQLDVRKLSKNFSSIRGAGGRHQDVELGEVRRESLKILYNDFKKLILGIDFKPKTHYIIETDN